MMTCAEFAKMLGRAAETAETGLVEPTEVVMKAVAAEAKRVVGTYEYGWPQLAEATQADRVVRGFSENDPLLRTGDMRASIATKAEPIAGGAEGLVYSGEKTALWAELGTKRGEPPRSFLMKSLVLATPVIAKTFGAFAERLLQSGTK